MSDELIERLRAESPYDGPIDDLLREAADALERAERVVEAARRSGFHSCPPTGNPLCSICIALAVYDMTRADTVRNEDLSKNWTDFSFEHTAEDFPRPADQHVRGLNAGEEKK